MRTCVAIKNANIRHVSRTIIDCDMLMFYSRALHCENFKYNYYVWRMLFMLYTFLVLFILVFDLNCFTDIYVVQAVYKKLTIGNSVDSLLTNTCVMLYIRFCKWCVV